MERAAPPDPSKLAKWFPQYEILSLIGHGGMGAVYKAKQRSLDRLVAIKIIMPESAEVAGFAERFSREAKTLAKLSHPNIIAVYDFGQVSPSSTGDEIDQPSAVTYYLVMEYVDGINLRQRMSAGILQPNHTLAIVAQICEALQYAHSAGVIHRDIKPENLLIPHVYQQTVEHAKTIRVKIADFGLAKLTESESDSALSGTNQVLGTLRYMAPEQWSNTKSVDHRADIYSLGEVFYELLTGNVPVGNFELPSKQVDVDRRIDDVVMRSLAREPSRRYQQVIEIFSDIEGIRSSPATIEVVAPQRERTRDKDLLPMAISLSIVASIAIGYWLTGSEWVITALTVPLCFHFLLDCPF